MAEIDLICKDMSISSKRENYLEWPEYFMALAFLSAQRSKDPASQVGACIINDENKIVGIGYNGMPNGCDDNIMPWGKNDPDPLKNKYMYVCHAEMNAILNKNSGNINGCTMYTALYPCNECAKLIIQSGIKKIVYMSKKNQSHLSYIASEKLFQLTGIECK